MGAELLALSIIILLLSVIIHEVAHGLAARSFGDHTAEYAGRLTLNPIPHIDPIGTILLPGLLIFSSAVLGAGAPFFIAWAKPVPVNPLNFSNIRKGELFVSLAGVAANFGLAIIGALFYHLFMAIAPSPFLVGLSLAMVNINLLLGIFNLLPIPPLDGSKVLLSQLPYQQAREFEKLEQIGPFILLALLVIKIGNVSVIGFILGIGVELFKSILGVA